MSKDFYAESKDFYAEMAEVFGTSEIDEAAQLQRQTNDALKLQMAVIEYHLKWGFDLRKRPLRKRVKLAWRELRR